MASSIHIDISVSNVFLSIAEPFLTIYFKKTIFHTEIDLKLQMESNTKVTMINI